MKVPLFRSGRVLIGVLLLAISSGAAQLRHGVEEAPALSEEEGRKQAQALVQDLLQVRPSESFAQNLEFKIYDRNDNETLVPARFEAVVTPTNFLAIYETQGKVPKQRAMKLTIVHHEKGPNEYLLSRPPESPGKVLDRTGLMQPFAGSDFWLEDLGLEFLHWPQQRIIKKQMRRFVFCDVLESINPQPLPGGYSKVLSWIGANRPDELVLVHSEAYDAQGRVLKRFDPKKLQNIKGSRELSEMEIRNPQRETRTKVEFEYPTQ